MIAALFFSPPALISNPLGVYSGHPEPRQGASGPLDPTVFMHASTEFDINRTKSNCWFV